MTVSAPEAAYPGRPAHRYLRPPQPLHFPVEELSPETLWHFHVRTALWQSVRDAFGDGAAIGSEQFVYWDPTDPKRWCAPDLFVRLGVPDWPFDCWKVWEHGAPELVVDIVSAGEPPEATCDDKLDRFRHLGAKEIVRFDRDDAGRPLRIWDAAEGVVTERDPASSAFNRCNTLGMYFCRRRDAEIGLMLRFARDVQGRDLLPTPGEWLQRDIEARQKAERRIAELEAELAKRGT